MAKSDSTPIPDPVYPVTVLVDGHVHQGVAAPKGAVIEVTGDERQFLIHHNIIAGE